MDGKSDEELTPQPAGGPEAGAQTGGAAAAGGAGEVEITPEIRGMIEEAVKKVRDEYEGAGGHIAKLKSKKDQEIAALRRQREEQQRREIEEALALRDSDPTTAANMLAGHVSALTAEQQHRAQAAQVAEWAGGVAAAWGLNPEDETVQAKLAELVAGGADTHEMMGELGLLLKEQRDKADKEAEALKKSLPELVQQEVRKALAQGGIAPDLTTPRTPSKSDDWRDLSAAELLKRDTEEKKRQLRRAT